MMNNPSRFNILVPSYEIINQLLVHVAQCNINVISCLVNHCMFVSKPNYHLSGYTQRSASPYQTTTI